MSTPSDPGSPPQIGETAEMREVCCAQDLLVFEKC